VSVARFIADQRTFYRVPYAVCCAILGVSVSWLYKWLDRPATPRQRRRAELDAEVLRMFKASGARTVRHAFTPTCSRPAGRSA
jgi:putative transposase